MGPPCIRLIQMSEDDANPMRIATFGNVGRTCNPDRSTVRAKVGWSLAKVGALKFSARRSYGRRSRFQRSVVCAAVRAPV